MDRQHSTDVESMTQSARLYQGDVENNYSTNVVLMNGSRAPVGSTAFTLKVSHAGLSDLSRVRVHDVPTVRCSGSWMRCGLRGSTWLGGAG